MSRRFQIGLASSFRSFEKFWPDLERSPDELRKEEGITEIQQVRPEREILAEILQTIRRLEHAQKGYYSGAAARAAQVSILWYDDLVRAVDYLADDLDYREYQLEREGRTDSDTNRRIQAEYPVVKSLCEYLKALESSKALY